MFSCELGLVALLELLPLVGLVVLVGLLELFVSPLPKGIGKSRYYKPIKSYKEL
ncbi:hypothetical protein HpBT252_06080 [Helicobacter pylori]